jgi:hypothetical protein
MSSLNYTAVTSSGQALEFEFPLHEQTRSADAVAGMLSVLLEALSAYVEEHGDVSDGDVLQAASMLLGVRARMVGAASPETLHRLCAELLDTALGAAATARRYPTSRA